MRRAAGVAALLLLAVAPAARAQYLQPVAAMPRGYISVAGGGSSYAADCGYDGYSYNYSQDCDRVGGALRAAAGIFMAPFFGFELAAADFGDSRVGSPYGDAEFRIRMAGIGVVLPVDYGARFNGLVRFGLASVRATLKPLQAGAPESSSTSVEGYYGLTMGYMLTPNLAIELSLDGTRGYAGSIGGRVDALTAGLSLRF
jgi:opacity protein-like surface antigen